MTRKQLNAGMGGGTEPYADPSATIVRVRLVLLVVSAFLLIGLLITLGQ